MHFHFEWFYVILRLNAHELLAFVYIFVECTLPRQSPIANRVLRKRQRKLIDVIDHHLMIFLTAYFRTTPVADVNFTSLVTSLVTCHHCVSFTVALVICKLHHIYTSLVAQRVYTSMMRIMQPTKYKSRVGLPYSLDVNVREAHEYTRAIQPCNTHLYCTVVTSWHCVLHHKLAINNFIYTRSRYFIIYNTYRQQRSQTLQSTHQCRNSCRWVDSSDRCLTARVRTPRFSFTSVLLLTAA